MNESFLYTPAEGSATSPKLHLAYMSLRTNTPLIISMVPAEDGMVGHYITDVGNFLH